MFLGGGALLGGEQSLPVAMNTISSGLNLFPLTRCYMCMLYSLTLSNVFILLINFKLNFRGCNV